MKALAAWFWSRGVVGAFLTGLFVILPLIITIVIMGWLGDKVKAMVGPKSSIGEALRSVGLNFATDPLVAMVIGWAIALVAIWLLGLFVRSTARYQFEHVFHRIMNRIPIIKSVYGPVSQVVGLLKQQDESELKGMTVVYCAFGTKQGGGFLALLTSDSTYRFRGEDSLVVYIPTSPLPMSGAIVLVPKDQVEEVEMTVDELMQIYFSMGVMASGAVPKKYHSPAEA